MTALYRNDFSGGVGSGVFAHTNASIALDNTNQIEGTNSLQVLSLGAGDVIAYKDQVEFPSGIQTRVGRARLKVSTGARNCLIKIEEYDNVGGFISSGASSPVSVGTTPTDVSCTYVTSGFGGSHLDLQVIMQSAAGVNEVLNIDLLGLNTAGDVGWTYIPSTLTGALSAAQLVGAPNPVKIDGTPMIFPIRERFNRMNVLRM